MRSAPTGALLCWLWGNVQQKQKQSGPVSRVLSRTIIYLGPTSPLASSAQPERSAGHTIALLFAFAPEGACQAAVSPRRWWSLTPPFQLFSHPPRRAAGVFFSAALSVGSPRQAVSLLPALWSPDFPHDPPHVGRAPRSSGPLCAHECSTTCLRWQLPMAGAAERWGPLITRSRWDLHHRGVFRPR